MRQRWHVVVGSGFSLSLIFPSTSTPNSQGNIKACFWPALAAVVTRYRPAFELSEKLRRERSPSAYVLPWDFAELKIPG